MEQSQTNRDDGLPPLSTRYQFTAWAVLDDLPYVGFDMGRGDCIVTAEALLKIDGQPKVVLVVQEFGAPPNEILLKNRTGVNVTFVITREDGLIDRVTLDDSKLQAAISVA